MFFKRSNFLVFVWMLSTSCVAAHDVSNVFFKGDSTLMGMKIESCYLADGAFLIETTGARFEYVNGELKLYQGLDKSSRRLLSTFIFETEPNFIKVETNEDQVLFWSEKINLGVYGDSTCIIFPKIKQQLKCLGNFKPDYTGRYKGELLLIDDLGGMELYPQRYEAGYKIKKIELGRKDWVTEYVLNAGKRVMIAVFPAKEFDWEKSFKSNVVMTCGSMGKGKGNPYGQMPSNSTIRQWAKNFHIVVMFYSGLYKIVDPGGPYVVANEPEFKRFVKTAHDNGLKVAAYSSFYYFARKSKNNESFYNQIVQLKDKFGIDGVYIDGCFVEIRTYKYEDKIASWEMIRRLRELFGQDGAIVLHGTHIGNPTGTVPNIDTYCDVTVNGEGIPFKSFNDPYLLYCVKKYGISNTVGIWYRNMVPASVKHKDIIDAIFKMNCRDLMGAFVVTDEPPPARAPHFGKYVWPKQLYPFYKHYIQKLAEQELKYRAAMTR